MINSGTQQADNTVNPFNNIKGVYSDLNRLLRLRHWAQELKLFSRQASRSMLLGETRSRFRGRGMEFEEVLFQMKLELEQLL